MKAKVISDGRIIEVYRLKEGTPTADHIWCNARGCAETFKESELEFTN